MYSWISFLPISPCLGVCTWLAGWPCALPHIHCSFGSWARMLATTCICQLMLLQCHPVVKKPSVFSIRLKLFSTALSVTHFPGPSLPEVACEPMRQLITMGCYYSNNRSSFVELTLTQLKHSKHKELNELLFEPFLSLSLLVQALLYTRRPHPIGFGFGVFFYVGTPVCAGKTEYVSSSRCPCHRFNSVPFHAKWEE